MMHDLKFILAKKSEIYPMRGESYLYNHEIYLQVKEKVWGQPMTFYALQGEKAVAKIHFLLVKQNYGGVEAISIPASPFGSFEYDETLSVQALADFIYYVKDSLLAQQVNCITIKDCIAAYRRDKQPDLQKLLLETGFRVQEEWVSHHIPVDEMTLSQKMHVMEARRLRKCQEAGFVFSREDIGSLKEIYDFISECRAEKGWGLSMRWDEIKETVSFLPQNYLFFTVKDKEKIVAATIAVLVNRQILYNFYPASGMSYNPFSPAVMLTSGLYQYCQQAKIKILDLGTSPTLSLQRFKQHLGGLPSSKRTYQYCV